MGARMDKIIFILLLFLSTISNGQELKGKVVDESNQPLPFVSIRIVGTTQGTQTDLSGEYKLSLENNSEVVFYCVGFEEYKFTTNGGEFNLTMKPKSVEVKEVEVSAKKIRSSENTLLMDKKESVGVETSIGSTELTKKGITNVEDGLKKITGITFNNGKLNTRGLDDRYNQVTLNGIPLASNNSDKKNIDINLLPTGIVENVKVRKTYSSDQWSNVGGAQIDVTTKDISDIKFISVRGQLNSYTPNNSGGISLNYGKQIKNVGLLFNLNLNNDYQNIDGDLNLVNKQGDYFLNYVYRERQKTLTSSGVFVFSYNKNKFELQNTLLGIGQNNRIYRETFGNHFDYQKQIFTTRLTPTTHNLLTNQTKLNYTINKWEFESLLSLSKINSGENNREQFVYLYDGNYQFNNIDKLDNHIFSNENIDDRINVNFVLKRKGKWLSQKWGYSYMYAINMFNYYQTYFDLGTINNSNSTINPNNPFSYFTSNNHGEYKVNDPASRVDGNSTIHSFFYQTHATIKRFDVDMGLRLEDVYQKIDYRDQLSPIFLKSTILDNLEFLPFGAIKFKINDKNQIKTTASVTTIRPRFREMVPFIYTEVFAGSKIQGNPELINSSVYSLDLSYELYPKVGEVVTFTTFTKLIKNPIERVNVATASGRLETFQNSEQSTVFGGELELRKQINKFKLDYNLSILYSQIQVSKNNESTVVVTNLKRSLQGSTPFISNIDLFYDINNKNSLGIVYNYTGKKLNSVGIFGLGDIYQLPQHTLNVVYNIKKERYNLSLRLNNLLNTPFILEQNTDKGEMITQKFRVGQDISLNFRYIM